LKRGWITWDRTELHPDILRLRIAGVRQILETYDLPALVVYTDIWRSNWGRYLSNFMPYWNRSLLVIPRERPPILLCALSPRVYPWIRSVTILDDIRPSPNLTDSLLKVCADYSWKHLGILDLEHLPQQIYAPLTRSGVSLMDILPEDCVVRTSDPNELSMWRRSVSIVRQILETELPRGAAGTDFELAGRLERAFRRAGIEDLLLLFGNGNTAPAPSRGIGLPNIFSVIVAAEYRGFWVRVARTQAPLPISKQVRDQFEEVLRKLGREKVSPTQACIRNLSGSYPYEYISATALCDGVVFSADVEAPINGARLFYGDTCRLGENGVELL
jgi:hypothetical protein